MRVQAIRAKAIREEGKVLLRRLLSGEHGTTQSLDGQGGAWKVASLLGHLSQELRAKGKHLELRVVDGVIDESGRTPQEVAAMIEAGMGAQTEYPYEPEPAEAPADESTEAGL